MSSQLVENQQAIEQIKTKRQELAQEYLATEEDLARLKVYIETMTAESRRVDSEYAVKVLRAEEQAKILREIEFRSAQASDRLHDLQSKIATMAEIEKIKDKTLATIVAEIEEKEAALKRVECALHDKAQKSSELSQEIASARATLTEVQTQLRQAKENLEQATAEIEAKRVEGEALITAAQNQIAQKEKELTEREGLLSEQIQWNKDKMNILKRIKADLERVWGRKISTVQFPED